MVDFTLSPPVATPVTVGAPPGGGEHGPLLYWEGVNPNTGLPATNRDDPSTLRNPVPIYGPLPGQKPSESGGAGGPAPGVSFTLEAPAAPAPSPAAPAVPTPLPAPPPQAPTAAPQAPTYIPVPTQQPQQGPATAPPQAPQQAPLPPIIPQRLMPPGVTPSELQPSQQPAPAQPMQLAPTVPQQPGQGPPGWGHSAGLVAAKAIEGLPLMAAGILDLPQTVGTGLYNYFTAQPTVAGALPQRPLSPELAQGAPPSGQQAAPGPPQPSDLASMPFFGRQVERAYRALGLPEPKSENEQTAAALAEAIGGTVGSMGLGSIGAVGRYAPRLAQALSSYKTQQLIGAGGSAGASEIARRSGAGPGMQFAAALLGGVTAPLAVRTVEGVGRGIGAAAASSQKIAARQLAAASSDPATLQARLRAAAGSGLGAPQTTAMAANDQGLARLEKAIRNTPGGARILRVEADRQAAVAAALQRLHPGGTETAAQRGDAIRTAMEGHDATIGHRVDQLYTAARAQPGTFSAQPAKDAVLTSAQKYYGPGSGGAPAAFTNIARQITQRAGLVNNRWVMNMDRQIGDAAREASRAGNNTLAAALGEVRNGLGRVSSTAEHAAAKAARARQGAVMGRDASGSNTVGRIVKEDQFGRPTMTGEQVAHASVATRAGVQQIIDAGHEALRAARASGASAAELNTVLQRHAATLDRMRAQLLDNGEAAARNVGGDYSAANWTKFWAKNDGAARLLFTPAHYADLRNVGRDLLDDARIRAMASAQGSHTVQHAAHLLKGDATVAHVVAAVSKGSGAGASIAQHIVPELPAIVAGVAGLMMGGAVHGGGAGVLAHVIGAPLIKGLMAHRTEVVQSLLHDAMANPQIAADLLRRGNAANFARMLQHSRVSNGMFWGLIRRLVPAVAGGEAGSTSYLPPVPQVAGAR